MLKKRVQFSNNVRVKNYELNKNGNRYISVVVVTENILPRLGNHVDIIMRRNNRSGEVTEESFVTKIPVLNPLKRALEKETEHRARKRRDKLIKDIETYKIKDKALFNALKSALKVQNTVTPSEISSRTWRKPNTPWLGPKFIKDWMSVQKHGHNISLKTWGIEYKNGAFKKITRH